MDLRSSRRCIRGSNSGKIDSTLAFCAICASASYLPLLSTPSLSRVLDSLLLPHLLVTSPLYILRGTYGGTAARDTLLVIRDSDVVEM